MRHGMASFVVGLAGLAAAGIGAQEPLRLTPAVAQLVVVDAFVTDNKGRPVSNLVAGDFELLDDHKEVGIVGFEAPRTGPAERTADREHAPGSGIESGASAPDADVMVIFIDRKMLSPSGRNRATAQTLALATEHLRQGGRAVVVAEDGPLRPLTPITANLDEVKHALERVGKMAIQAPGADQERVVLSQFEAIIGMYGCLPGLPELINVVRDYARWRGIETQEARDRLNGLVDALVGLPGRKALIYVSEGLEQRPGIHLFEQITSICPEVLHRESGQIFAAMQEIETSPVLKEAAARANAARVTLYPLHARGPMSASGMDLSQTDRRYIPTAKNDFIRDANLVNSYQLLAEETGGFPMVRGLSPAVATQRLQAEAAGHYVLAFTPSREPDGKAHDLTVRLRKERRGVRIRHRMSYLHADPVLHRGQRVLSALMFGLEENALRATLQVERLVSPAGGEATARVKIGLPLDALRFEESEAGRQSRVRVVVALRSTSGDKARSAAVVREKEFTIELPSGPPAAGLHDVFVDVPIDGASHDFAVGVEDSMSGAATYLRRTLDVAGGDGLGAPLGPRFRGGDERSNRLGR